MTGWMGAARRRLIGLDPEKLAARARALTGLDDFGLDGLDGLGADALWRPLNVLCESLESEARLTTIGRIAARQDALRLLSNRLAVVDWRHRHPEIAGHPIRRPVFIVGLPRTGTTALHNLLAQDPDNRVPRTWEVMYPSPPPAPGDGTAQDPRIARAGRAMKWLDRLAPEFKTVHPLGPRLPQECIAITAHTFRSVQFPTMYFVPGYQAWLDRCDPAPAYGFHKLFLQHLQARDPARRWVLKAPGHLFTLAALFATYPDAVVVQTHRDPVDVVASLASLIATLHRAFSNRVDPRAVGPELTARWAGALTRAIGERDRLAGQGKRFLDIHYTDFIADPMATVAGLYDRLGTPLTDHARRRMTRFLAANPKDKHGRHRYNLAQFGLNREDERRRFKAYCQRFGINTG